MQRDAALGLPIVTCPECGDHSVRRRAFLVTEWRTAMRRRYAIWTLIAQLVVFNSLLWTAVGLSWSITEQMWTDRTTLVTVITDAFQLESSAGRHFSNVGPWHIAIWLIVSITAGLWMGAALPHWKRWAPYLVWPIALAAAASAPMIAWLIWWPLATLADRPPVYFGPTRGESLVMAQVVMASFAITVVALQAGPLVSNAWKRSRNRRWRKRLARARRARSGE